MTDTGWDDRFVEVFAAITEGAPERTVALADLFAVEFYERLCGLLADELDSRIGALVNAGVTNPDLLKRSNAELLASELWMPRRVGGALYDIYRDLLDAVRGER